ncbi:MAG: hypothetical protein J7500_00210 [Sphingomonas sp.]|uniref:hypothetical protein n=1 Tax=Sphingomonas sp. TaxID=28214 RepID=UPI001B0801BA|nr:hypothetical protein [Sphingomonas sp.]MBO9621148.1 hypothetical protein [Sphingomonas sp.]
MTVEAETPAGARSGSSVMEVSAYKRFALTSEDRSGGGSFRAEAVVVDLPSGPVFVLPTLLGPTGYLGARATEALLPDRKMGSIDGYVAAVTELGSGKRYEATLPRADWPLMVRFRDIGDPTTVEAADPETAGIRRIRLETTADPVTTGVEKRFPPWFLELLHSKARFNGKHSIGVSSHDLADNLSPGAFSTEIGK